MKFWIDKEGYTFAHTETSNTYKVVADDGPNRSRIISRDEIIFFHLQLV